MKKEAKKKSINWDEIAGWYVIILSLLILFAGIYLSFLMDIITSFKYIGRVGELVIGSIILLLISSIFMIFVGFKIKKKLKWAKISALIIFILGLICFLRTIDFKISVMGVVLFLFGMIFVSLSLKSK